MKNFLIGLTVIGLGGLIIYLMGLIPILNYYKDIPVFINGIFNMFCVLVIIWFSMLIHEIGEKIRDLFED